MDYSLFPILQKFDRLSWKADNPNLGQCRCPAHEDSTNSLHITIKVGDDGNPKILLLCHAGCDNGSILRALGEGFSSLFPDRTRRNSGNGAHSSSAGKKGVAGANANGKQDPKFIKAYDYLDADGKLLHQTIRWEPKFFTQRRRAEPNQTYTIGTREYKSFRDPRGNWWINTLAGIEPVIYRLPEILKADPRKIIFLCEGEKDADNLKAKFGFYATTVPMGAGKWRASYTKIFRGRRVIIIPDTDKPRKGQTDPEANAGYDGARKVAAELVTVAHEVRICYLPSLFNLTPKWDLSDWLDTGGTKVQFIEACSAAPVLHIGHPGLAPAGITAATVEAEVEESDESHQDQNQDQNSGSTEIINGHSTLPAVIKPQNLDPYYNQPIRGHIFNVIETADGFDPLSMRGIVHNFKKVTDNWPKRVGSALFYVDRENSIDPDFFPIRWLNSASSLFGWAGSYSGNPVSFAKASGCHSKEEVFTELQNKSESFESVEQYPHEPRVPTVYYACKQPEEWKSERPGCLYELVSRFCPATPVDYDLIVAFLATLVWGGGGGLRPIFVITADTGRGAGKTTFVSLAASLVGGSIQISSLFDDHIVRQRLLSPEGLEKRVILFDNIKSRHFSSADLEAFATADKISGKQMYVGESSRSNRITYILTMNGPSLSTDMSQRSVVIKLGKPLHSGDWLQDTANFISKYKTSIIAELLELLRQPSKTLESHTRWGDWERNVLCKLDNATICQESILGRQKDIDAEQDESNLIMDYFERQLMKNNMRTDYDKILIPSGIAAEWLNKALNERHSTVSAGRMLTQKVNEGRLPRIERAANAEKIDQTNRRERGFWWVPEGWKEDDPVIRPGGMSTFDVDDWVRI